MKLSIIIPTYNAEPYIHELLSALTPQITEETEVIIVDDGSSTPLGIKYKWAKVIRQANKGASAARNTGLVKAQGEYIAFIDADDLISHNYISKVLEKIDTEEPDYIYLSPGNNHFVQYTCTCLTISPFRQETPLAEHTPSFHAMLTSFPVFY